MKLANLIRHAGCMVLAASVVSHAAASPYVPPAPFVGAKLTIPFGGQSDTSADSASSIRFGAGFVQSTGFADTVSSGSYRVLPAPQIFFLADTALTTDGTVSMNFGGMGVNEISQRLSVDGDSKNGSNTGLIVGGVVALVLVAGIASAAALKDATRDTANAIVCATGQVIAGQPCPPR
jgi:hypothetical protein